MVDASAADNQCLQCALQVLQAGSLIVVFQCVRLSLCCLNAVLMCMSLIVFFFDVYVNDCSALMCMSLTGLF